jgi:hypothetical protein
MKVVQKIKGVSFVWSNEVIDNLSKELERDLDNKKFFTAKDYYKSAYIKPQTPTVTKISNFAYAENTKTYDFSNTVKGMSFSNKVGKNDIQKTIDDLSLEKRRIYKISDLLSANLAETIVIPYNVTPTSLALIKRFDWKDVLFSDFSTAWGMIKSKFNWK